MSVDFRNHPTFTAECVPAKAHDNISLKNSVSAVHIA